MTKRAVVSGASTGIGWATVEVLRERGWDVVATARREDRLAQLAEDTGCETVVADLTVMDDVRRLAEQVGSCDALINNAGGAIGLDTVAGGKPEEWRRMYDINVIATLHLTQALLPALREATCGDVLTVTSTAAQQTYEGGAGYCGAKMAEAALVEALRLELNGEPVRVTQIAPGLVATEEFSLNRFHGDQAKADAVYNGVDEPLVARDIAECIEWMLSRPAHVNIDSMTVRPIAQAANHKLHRST